MVTITHPNSPKRNINKFFIPFQLKRPRSFQFDAVSIIAGAIKLKIDILTDPSNATKRSSHGTVAASKTKTKYRNIVLSFGFDKYNIRYFIIVDYDNIHIKCKTYM